MSSSSLIIQVKYWLVFYSQWNNWIIFDTKYTHSKLCIWTFKIIFLEKQTYQIIILIARIVHTSTFNFSIFFSFRNFLKEQNTNVACKLGFWEARNATYSWAIISHVVEEAANVGHWRRLMNLLSLASIG